MNEAKEQFLNALLLGVDSDDMVEIFGDPKYWGDEYRHAYSTLSDIANIESDLAAAQATIEKQRKVIEWFASRPHVFEKSPCKMCIKYLNDGCPHPPDRECITGVIAYAEKQVEEGKW